MICPKCGENNAENFRFCGMCGAVLETVRPAAAPRAAAPKVEPPRPGDVPVALRIPANPPRGAAASERSTLNSGPSLLGLGQAGPTLDSLREKAFSGVEPRFEIEQPKGSRGRTIALALILAVLGVGVWLRYQSFFGGEMAHAPATEAGNAGTSGGAVSEAAPPKQDTDVPSAAPAQPVTPPPAVAPKKPANAAAQSLESQAKTQAPPAQSHPAARTVVTAKQTAKADSGPPIHAASTKTAAFAKPAAAEDSGDAAFRKGEAYLYGRGVAENCEEAIKNLKAASARNNAKARSTFGTMYATGHCVPRDLPTSYSWFALALRADPNNQILEKDLSAIWNQMTPPERQLAMRQKQ